MSDKFINSQEMMLKSILQSINKSALFKHLNLQHLLYENQWNSLYEEFTEHVPVGNILSYLNMLRAITGDIRASDIHVLSYPKIISNEAQIRVALLHEQAFPVSKSMLKESFIIEEKLLKGQIIGLDKVKGKIFHIFDDMRLEYSSDLMIGDFHSIRHKCASWSVKRKIEPKIEKFSGIGKSKYQKVHAFLTRLEEIGKDVEVLVVRPQILSEMSLILAQREGRAVPIIEICPNLKLLAHYGENIAPYKQSISVFFKGLACKKMEIIAHPSGLIAYQENVFEKGLLRLSDAEGVFYEFVPVKDLKSDGTLKRHFRRKCASQVKIGNKYVLIISNKAGLLGFNTEIIVKIKSIEPFVIIYKGATENLDYFGERINPYLMEKLIENINDTLVNYNFYIREYLIGDHLENGKSYWLFELNKDLQHTENRYLQSAANTIHNEMSLQNNSYRQVIMDGSMNLPHIYFLPVGAISNILNSAHLNHVDFDEESSTIISILDKAAEFKKFTPDNA